jgi:hypothetical protein
MVRDDGPRGKRLALFLAALPTVVFVRLPEGALSI